MSVSPLTFQVRHNESESFSFSINTHSLIRNLHKQQTDPPQLDSFHKYQHICILTTVLLTVALACHH